MPDHNNDIDALLRYLDCGVWPETHAALTALVAERDGLRKERQMYWESCDALERQHLDLRAELAAAIKQRDEAHGLILKWRLNLVDVVEVGEYMDAMTSDARIGMNDADKRAFLAATQKEGGGA